MKFIYKLERFIYHKQPPRLTSTSEQLDCELHFLTVSISLKGSIPESEKDGEPRNQVREEDLESEKALHEI